MKCHLKWMGEWIIPDSSRISTPHSVITRRFWIRILLFLLSLKTNPISDCKGIEQVTGYIKLEFVARNMFYFTILYPRRNFVLTWDKGLNCGSGSWIVFKGFILLHSILTQSELNILELDSDTINTDGQFWFLLNQLFSSLFYPLSDSD